MKRSSFVLYAKWTWASTSEEIEVFFDKAFGPDGEKQGCLDDYDAFSVYDVLYEGVSFELDDDGKHYLVAEDQRFSADDVLQDRATEWVTLISPVPDELKTFSQREMAEKCLLIYGDDIMLLARKDTLQWRQEVKPNPTPEESNKFVTELFEDFCKRPAYHKTRLSRLKPGSDTA